MLTINNTIDVAIQDIEIKGNTVQDPDNLSDIKSVGELQEDGTYKMSILSCGKNLFDGQLEFGTLDSSNGNLVDSTSAFRNKNKFIKVKNGSNIIFAHISALIVIIEYDKNFQYIKSQTGQSFTLSSNTRYINFRTADATSNYSQLQLEEGTVATPYEPYQGNKCDILLPCQLEKVEDESDRLYYDDVEKAWCIEKNVVKIPLYESVNKINGDWETLYFSKTLSFDKVKNASSYCISSLLNYNGQDISTEDTITQLCIFGHANNFECRIRLRKDEFPNITTNEDYIKWATENDFYILLQSASPQKIVLPLDVQIQLNSFFGTTHIYMESGEVEGTIKCKIPKSIGATVQTLNNKTDILSDRIEAIEGLKDSQNMKYETDKGYLVCKETKNGVIDDLKIEGKTLVNLCGKVASREGSSQSSIVSDDDNNCTNVTITSEGSSVLCYDINSQLKPSTTYTAICQVKTDYLHPMQGYKVAISFRNVSGTDYGLSLKTFATADFSSQFVSVITTIQTDANSEVNKLVIGNHGNQGVGKTLSVKNVILLEGDHAQNPPSYFEGLMSVGEDVDEISVESCGKNINSSLIKRGNINANTGIEESGAKTMLCTESFIRAKSETRYVISSNISIGSILLMSYDEDKKYLGYCNVSNGYFETKIGTKYVKFRFAKSSSAEFTDLEVSTIKVQLEEGTQSTPYTPHQSDKKQILFYNENGELEPIQELHEWDSIEKHSDNKWYYHKRSGKVVLNGSETISLNANLTKENTMYFEVKNISNNELLLCDRFMKLSSGSYDEEGILGNKQYSNISIRILKSKLSTQDVEGFKQWLQANNVTVVYQLAEEEVYELAPLHLDSYANETLILCNSGAISPKMEFSITSHINELVKAYGERVNLLEEKVYQYMVTQNRMQLASTYSADSVTFKVDYCSLCGDEENYNEDLYNLILNNILVGKDNYNYDKMFTIILDYASWNQISWEQFDILVGLMDIQHNPPVEELPTEDEIEEDIIEEETPVE